MLVFRHSAFHLHGKHLRGSDCKHLLLSWELIKISRIVYWAYIRIMEKNKYT